MERKIGEIFTYKGKTYQVVESITCKNCAFFNTRCNFFQTLVASTCTPEGRKDNISVSFKLINNMENNQLTIDIPKGMEIDLENSDLAKGIVKFRSKWLTIAEIISCEWSYSSITVSVSTRKKIIAISNLMDIAKYYNGDWEPDWDNQNEYKYSIIYNRGIYKVDYGWMTIFSNIYFKNKKDAQAVIDNPNFRDILDAVYKN